MHDDREFKECLKKYGGYGSEGASRGYLEIFDGTSMRVVSIKKYYVHQRCYKPISGDKGGKKR